MILVIVLQYTGLYCKLGGLSCIAVAVEVYCNISIVLQARRGRRQAVS